MTRTIINKARHVHEHGEKPEMARHLRRICAPTDDDLAKLKADLAPFRATVEESGPWMIVTMRPAPRARELVWEKIGHRHWQSRARGMLFTIRGKGNHYHATRTLHGIETLLAVKPTFTLAAEAALSDLLA